MADTIADVQRKLDAWERLARDLDKENDDLRRENEAFRKALGNFAPMVVTLPGAVHKVRTTMRVHAAGAPDTQLSADPAPPAEMCCGGTCVRAVCTFHGPQS